MNITALPHLPSVTALPPITTPTTPTTTPTTEKPVVVERPVGQPTFLDVFTQVYGDTVELSGIVSQDRIRMVLGEADDLEMIQLNREKAGFALELLTNIRNTVLESYNEIIRMQI